MDNPLADCEHGTVIRYVVDGIEEWRCDVCALRFVEGSKLHDTELARDAAHAGLKALESRLNEMVKAAELISAADSELRRELADKSCRLDSIRSAVYDTIPGTLTAPKAHQRLFLIEALLEGRSVQYGLSGEVVETPMCAYEGCNDRVYYGDWCKEHYPIVRAARVVEKQSLINERRGQQVRRCSETCPLPEGHDGYHTYDARYSERSGKSPE